jgi:DNA invertase Pin-like site-specific DNA recombinase
LAYLRNHSAQYVIVHKVDRLARNRADDIAITLAIEQKRSDAGLLHREYRRNA